MSKYIKLWEWISGNEAEALTLSFEEIEKIAGVPLDHSFLSFKKELSAFGYKVGKISMKNKNVSFEKSGKKE